MRSIYMFVILTFVMRFNEKYFSDKNLSLFLPLYGWLIVLIKWTMKWLIIFFHVRKSNNNQKVRLAKKRKKKMKIFSVVPHATVKSRLADEIHDNCECKQMEIIIIILITCCFEWKAIAKLFPVSCNSYQR